LPLLGFTVRLRPTQPIDGDGVCDTYRSIGVLRRAEIAAKRRISQLELRGRTHARRQLNTWRARIRQARSAQLAGLDARQVKCHALLHPKSGLLKYVDESADGWTGIIRRCRRELRRVARIVQRQEESEMRHGVRLANQASCLPEDDFMGRLRLAQQIVRGPRQSTAMSEVRVQDRDDGRRVNCMDDDAGSVMAANGAKMVKGFDTGCVPPAYQAMCDKFVGRWPALAGIDGEPWDLRKELSFRTFLRVVRGMKPKAVGKSGFAAAMLKCAGRGVLRSVYNAIVGDIARDCISERWHEIMYVLLVKPPPNRPHIMSERREIALTEHDVKILLHMLRRVCFSRIMGRVSHVQTWLGARLQLLRSWARLRVAGAASSSAAFAHLFAVCRPLQLLLAHCT
jgi:hypothetical protein